MTLYTDAELLYMIHQKDEWALNCMIERYMPVIRNLIYTHYELKGCSISAQAFREDLIQESCIMIVSATDNYREDGGSTFRTYLTHCLRRQLITLYRHSRSMRETAFYQCESLDMMVGEEHAVYRTEMVQSQDRFMDPEYCFRLKEAGDQLKQMRRFFTDEEWQLFSLNVGGVPYVEAARIMGCSPKAYDNRLFRIKQKFRALLAKFEEES